MAVRMTLPARNINGEFISPDVRLSAFGDISRYTLECNVENAADVVDPTKSASVFIEYLDESVTPNVWRCGGGAHWRGAAVLDKNGNPASPNFSVRTWAANPDGSVVDVMRGARVRIRATTPAQDYDTGTALFPDTGGTVRLSGQIVDERVS